MKRLHSYAASRPAVRAQILERLAAGERLKHVCRSPGMPCVESVNGWMRRDAAFAAEVAAARARGEGRWGPLAMDEGRARALLARLAAGEAIGDVLRDPAMPGRRTYRHWRAQYAWFAEEVFRLNGVKAEAKAARLRGRLRAYDAAVGERLYLRLCKGEGLRAVLRSDPAFPSRAVLARWRREEPAFDAMLRFALVGWRRRRGRARRLCTPELTEAIVAGIVEGGSLRSLSRRPDMPSQRTLYAWCRTRPEFAAAVARACEDREDWYYDTMLDLSRAAGEGGLPLWEAQRWVTELNKQLTRLRKRPGWKARKAASGRSSAAGPRTSAARPPGRG